VGWLLAQSTPLFSWAALATAHLALRPSQSRGARPHGGAGGDPAASAMPATRGVGEEARRTTEVRGVNYGGGVVGAHRQEPSMVAQLGRRSAQRVAEAGYRRGGDHKEE
jgi:hypothetical protein